MKALFLSSLTLLLSCFVNAQDDYFQQDVSYKINVALDDSLHMLDGDISISYTNNSPDDLSFIYIHLWPNAYDNKHSAMSRQHMENGDFDFYFATPEEMGYIRNLDFKSGENTLNWDLLSDTTDIAKVELPNPLKPGQTIEINTPFRVKIPSGSISRLGHIGQSYQITQWYPKPAVYDKDGWHQMPYLSQGEFYSEFGDFDVSITLPDNYVMSATGDLQNEGERQWLHELAQETTRMFEEFGASGVRKKGKRVQKETGTKTLRFKQSQVHDFAWFADKRYFVLHDTVKLPHTGKIVDCWSMFTAGEAHLWEKSIEYIKDGLYYYSLWNGDYPYNHCTAVDGTISAGGGMEYPNITVIGRSGNAAMLETTIVHEVGHNWFYGILGSNERDHAWMDEGLNTLNENRYLETKYPENGLFDGYVSVPKPIQRTFGLEVFKQKSLHEFSYLLNARRNYDQAIELNSAEYTPTNYGGIVYSKTGIVFDYLKAYLGNKLFDECMQAYYEKWKFKHPQPEDLQNVLEETSGHDLDWFFDDVIKTTKTIDFKIVSAKISAWKSIEVKVVNKGEINGPFAVAAMSNDSVLTYQWYDSIPENGTVLLPIPKEPYNRIKIDPYWEIPEINRSNNTLKTIGLLKKVEPIKLQFLASLENPNESRLFYLPYFGWNYNDGFQTGLAFYNSLFPKKRLEFGLAPGFSWKSKTFTGAGFAQYNFKVKHNSIFQNVNLRTSAKRFSAPYADDIAPYIAINSSLNFEFRRKRLRYSPKNTVSFKFDYTDRNNGAQANKYGEVEYSFNKRDPFYAINLVADVSHGDLYYDASFTRGNIDLTTTLFYGWGRYPIALRAYGAYFFQSLALQSPWAAQLSGETSNADYTFDNWYLSRGVTDRLLVNQQFVRDQGGLRAFYPIVSNTYLSTLSLDVRLPIFVDISMYGDLGFYPVTLASTGQTATETVGDLGVSLGMFSGLLKVYFPVLLSERISDYYDLRDIKYGQSIRFELKLDMLNPLKRIDAIQF